MKLVYKFTVLVLILLSTACQSTNAQPKQSILDSADISFLKTFQDSVDIDNLQNVFQIGYQDIYNGNNERGNRILTFVLSHVEEPNYELLHAVAVQNLKNGNYAIANDLLSRAAALSDEVFGYFGWVMLYYFRDYERSLKYLDKYDSLTPNFSDAPLGEDINYLRGLAYLQLKQFKKAIESFESYIIETTNAVGEDWVEVSTFYYKGIAHYKLREYVKAEKAFERAVYYNENYTEANYYLYLTFQKQEKTKGECFYFLKKAKKLADKGFFRTDVYVTYFYPVYSQMIDKEFIKK